MRTYQAASLLLTAASCLIGHLGWAQRTPIVPLVPVTPVVTPPASGLGIDIQAKPAAAPAPLVITPQPSRPTIPEPVIILNGRYLTGMNVLGTINPQQIAKIDVYKQGRGPMQWRSLTAPGILNITLKAKPRVKLKARSLAAIKRRLKLHGPVRFELNGVPIQDESLQVVTEAVAGVDVTRATPATAAKTVVNIRLVPYKPRPIAHPPGTIMIRGLAQQ
jgi:hypothetical protein